VVRETTYAEQRLSDALREMNPGLTADELTVNALEGSERIRRKEVARWVRGLLAAAGCITFYFFMQNVFIPRVDPPQRVVRETIFLHCITPQQAAEIATPYLRSHGSSIYMTGSQAITLSGQPAEYAQAVNHIRVLDDEAKCALPAVVSTPATTTPAPTPGATSSGIPGKD